MIVDRRHRVYHTATPSDSHPSQHQTHNNSNGQQLKDHFSYFVASTSPVSSGQFSDSTKFVALAERPETM